MILSTNKRRFFRWILWAVLLFAAIVPAFYAFENWRGARAWNEAREVYEASGRSLEWSELLPSKRFSDESNFCMIPLLRNISLINNGAAEANRKRLQVPRFDRMTREQRTALGKARDFERGHPFDFQSFRDALGSKGGIPLPADEPDPSRAILIGIEEAIDWFGELDAATSRPNAQVLPLTADRLDPSNPFLLSTPHLGTLRGMVRWLSYRAIAAVGCGEKSTVRTSLTSGFRLVQAETAEPTLIGQLVAMTMTATMMRPIWDSLHERLWTDAELQWLDSELSRLDTLSGYRQSLMTENAFGATAWDYLKGASMKDYRELMGLGVQGNGGPAAFVRLKLSPDGWFDQQKAIHVRMMNRLLDALSVGDFSKARETLESIRGEKIHYKSPFTLFGDLSMFSKSCLTAATIHTLVQEARIAVAMERYFLREQSYPQALEDLVPTCIDAIPPDPMGDTWRYVPNADHSDYHFYSIGWNLVDDGGAPAVPKERESADFVWFR